MVRYLCELPLERGVQPGAFHSEALTSSGHLRVVVYLCQLPAHRGVNVAVHNNCMLRWATRNGFPSVARCLYELPPERGVDPTAADPDRGILLAARRRQTPMVQYLCQLPSVRRALGQTTLVRQLCALFIELLEEQTMSSASVPSDRLGVVRPLAYVMVEAGTRQAEHPVSAEVVQAALRSGAWDVVRFLVFELPGGGRWLPLIKKHGTRRGRRRGAEARVRRLRRSAKLQQRVWDRRDESLLRLRSLRGAGRVRAIAQHRSPRLSGGAVAARRWQRSDAERKRKRQAKRRGRRRG